MNTHAILQQAETGKQGTQHNTREAGSHFTFFILVATADLWDLLYWRAFSEVLCRFMEFCFATTWKAALAVTGREGLPAHAKVTMAYVDIQIWPREAVNCASITCQRLAS